jgi:hypothetical protein
VDDVLCGGTFVPVHDLELDLLPLFQRLEPIALDGREMDEAVLFAIFAGDEPEPLLVVEPLHRAGHTHVPYSF